jgi:hypothetical protein
MFLLIGHKHELYTVHYIVHWSLNPSAGDVPTFSISKMKSVLKFRNRCKVYAYRRVFQNRIDLDILPWHS